MTEDLSRVTTLLVAVTILLVGHGMQLTLLPVHALAAGWSGNEIGLTGSFYFVGFVSGCIWMPAVVARVGHIRSFMVMAAVATIALLAASMLVTVWSWVLLRLATGAALAGLYMIVESWLSDVTPPDKRGRVLSVYLAVSLVGMALGQVPITFAAPGDVRLFGFAAIMLSLAIVPIGLTRIASPNPIPIVQLSPKTVLRASRVAVVCALLAGMVTGSFWALGPVVAGEFGLAPGQVGQMMIVGVIGGAAAQFPIGKLSDRMDRRIVMGLLAAVGAVVIALAAISLPSGPLALFAGIFSLCAVAMPIYGLCIALAAEKTTATLIEITSGILLTYGIGSILGPLLAAPALEIWGAMGFLMFCAGCMIVGAAWTMYRYLFVERVVTNEVHGPMLPRTTQAVSGLAPRSDPSSSLSD